MNDLDWTVMPLLDLVVPDGEPEHGASFTTEYSIAEVTVLQHILRRRETPLPQIRGVL